MTLRHLVASAVLTLALVLTGCSSADSSRDRDVPTAFPNHTVQQMHQRIVTPTDTLLGYSAKARLVVDAPQQSGQFNATVRQRRNDSLYMSISPGFGVEAARMLVTADSFFVYDRINQRLAYGSVEAAQRRMPLPITNEAVFENMMGILAPDPTASWQVEADEQYYYLTDPSGQRTYTIDPSIWRVVRYEERTPGGDLNEVREFAEYGTFDGVSLPRRLTLRRPNDDASASLYYEEIELNPGSLSFDLRVGNNVQRVPLLGAR
jgi:hypothetical protein